MRINKYITGTLVALCAAGPAMGHHEQTLSSAAANLSPIEDRFGCLRPSNSLLDSSVNHTKIRYNLKC